MASPSPKPPSRASPPKRVLIPSDREAPDSDVLTQSLNHLTISTSSPSPVKSPRSPRPLNSAGSSSPLKHPVDRSPSTPRSGSALRSSSNGSSRTPSRSATPTLLRKASMNSLHSVSGVAPPRRASSVNVSALSPSAARSPFRESSPEEKPPQTAESVASAFFKAELATHHDANTTRDLPAETVVILNDACYGHRYSRPRTSRAALSTIVERPERIKACVMGVSAAYVRLGDRHQDGAFPIHPRTNPATLPSIPFRIQKTTRRLSLSSQTVTNVHGAKWMEELKLMCDSAETKLAMNGKELQRPTQDKGANGEVPQKLHEGDLYLCAESLDALEGALGGVCDAVDAVFRPQGPRRAFVAIRPPGHHCSATYPSGFCWVNNVHVGIMHGILSHGLTHAAIIDFDLHHGDGSQAIAWQHNMRSVGLTKNAALWKKTSIGYFSLHDINSYPCEMGDEEKVKNASLCIDNAHGQNVWNVHLEPWKTEADFWALYESKYYILLEKMRSYLRGQAERLRASGMNSRAAIFLSAGFDASEWEGAGMQRHNVNVPTEFYARLTRDVVRIAAEEGTSVEGRIISVLEGGYSDRALCSGVLSHLCGLAGDGPNTKDPEPNGLGSEMGQRIGLVRGRKDSSASERGARRYEPSWWSPAELEQLEGAQAPPPEPKKPRNTTPPTYSSPTQASVARSVVVPRLRRSASGLSLAANGSPISRPPSPPPPEVLWNVATHALSKLLIPSGRQTDSCTHEDLNAEATKARRDRQSALAQSLPPGSVPATQAERAPTRMALRGRKAKPTLPIDEEDAELERKNRRKTVAGPSVLAVEKGLVSRGGTPVPGKQPTRQSGRRLSAASTIVSGNLDLVEPAPLSAPLQDTSRPDTSLSIRPESSISVRTVAGNSLPVKKTRAPAKKEPVPRAPRAPKRLPSAAVGNTITAKPSKASPPTASSAGKPQSPSSAEQTGDDMDALTDNMKKVKITLVTKAQREARERERKSREKVATTKSITVVTPLEENKPLQQAEQTKQPSTTTTPLTTPPAPLPSGSPLKQAFSSTEEEHYFPDEITSPGYFLPSDPPTPATGPLPHTPMPMSKYPPFNPQRVPPLPASSPMVATPTTRSSPTRNGGMSPTRHSSPDMFVQYQPEGPTPQTIPLQNKQQPLQWLPPNTTSSGPTAFSTPLTTGQMRKADLPVFTATSAIPFAPSPSRLGVTSPAGGGGGGRAASPPDVFVKMEEGTEESKNGGSGFDGSVWEIPETPAPRKWT
ncbi:hypothetical protein B0H66DRAFT_398546 [Apodospora peruviana]|uniref:Histone deacetylase domain-containing protein n=1 Tax=Apodospora peruviana TaxID=516989 RepID=A0AAE0HTI7_9PEZI|nr:hypothetical protein B0H66DRAFT_398546 [Apodospora peruviana]